MYISIDHLEEKFKGGRSPYWKLYEGKSKTKCIAKNLDVENIDESWVLLEKEVNYYENGNFNLVTLSSRTANNSTGVNISFQVGDGGVVSSSVSGHRSNRSGSSQRSPMMDFMQMMTFLQKQNNDQVMQQMKWMQQSLRGEYENQRLLDRIEAMEEGPVGDPMIQDVKEVIGMLTGGQPLFNMGPQVVQQPTAIGTAGQKEPPAKDNGQKAPGPQPGVYDLNHLHAVAKKLEEVYPQYHPNVVMDGLLHFIIHNRATADNIIHQLMNARKQPNYEG